MKFLLTSGGVTKPSIRDALVDLLGKPIAESTALCIPTAQWGHPVVRATSARGFVVGEPPCTLWAVWAGSRSASSSSLHCHHRQGALVPWVREADVCSWTGAMRLPVSLDARVRVSETPAVAVRDRLGGRECRQHGDDSPDRCQLRKMAVRARRPTLGLSTSQFSRHLDHKMMRGTLCRRGAMGGRHRGSGIRDGRQDALKVVDGVVELSPRVIGNVCLTSRWRRVGLPLKKADGFNSWR